MKSLDVDEARALLATIAMIDGLFIFTRPRMYQHPRGTQIARRHSSSLGMTRSGDESICQQT